MQVHRGPGGAGFTLLEALVVIAVIAIAALAGFPALLKTIHRSRVEGFARETAMVMQGARLEAIKRNQRAGVELSFAEDRVFSFLDRNGNNVYDAGEELGASLPLPPRTSFWGPADASPEGADAVIVRGDVPGRGFESDAGGGWMLFEIDGSVPDSGAFRIGDSRGNFLEVIIDPPATGRIQVRKHMPGLPAQDDGTNFWALGEGGARSWTWY